GTMTLIFLKIGAVLYGSGYVLLAFLRRDFVERLGWLTDRQLLDAVAVGQVTPGPVFTTATFIGFVLAGVPGAVLATVAIFLPSFVLVAVSRPWLPRLRGARRAAAFLDGVNVAALGLMAAVAWQLGRSAIVHRLPLVLASCSASAAWPDACPAALWPSRAGCSSPARSCFPAASTRSRSRGIAGSARSRHWAGWRSSLAGRRWHGRRGRVSDAATLRVGGRHA